MEETRGGIGLGDEQEARGGIGLGGGDFEREGIGIDLSLIDVTFRCSLSIGLSRGGWTQDVIVKGFMMASWGDWHT